MISRPGAPAPFEETAPPRDPLFETTSNIASHLPAMAARQPGKRAVVVPDGRAPNGSARWAAYTFAELDAASDRYAAGLESAGIRRGIRTVLMVKPDSLHFFALVFALFKVGAIVVLIDPGIGSRKLKQCLREVEPEAFVGIPLAHVARIAFGSALRSVRVNVTVGRRWFWGGPRLRDLFAPEGTAYEMAAPDPGQVAAILFTSGSTGIPKGAVYTHGMFTAQVASLKRMYRFEADEVDLATFPLFALFDPALGMTCVVPDMDARKPGEADPVRIAEAIEAGGCTNMFASPALLRNLGRWGQETGRKLPTLRRVLSAGAPARTEILEQVQAMLTGNAEIFTPYGATEALPVASIGSWEVLRETAKRTAEGAGICVGRPVEGVAVRIIRITDEPIERWSPDLELPRGEIGEITVQGRQVTAEYHGRPDQTALAKIREGGRVVHRMGDLGYFDEGGRLWMCGRKSHRVVTRHRTLFTIPIERIFDEHPAVRQSALVGAGPQDDRRPVLLVERDTGFANLSDADLVAQLLELRGRHEAAAPVTEIVVYPGRFPVDVRHNAKIVREDLTTWAARRLR